MNLQSEQNKAKCDWELFGRLLGKFIDENPILTFLYCFIFGHIFMQAIILLLL